MINVNSITYNIRMKMDSAIKRIVVVGCLLLNFNTLFAQDTLESMTSVNTGQYRPTVADANKINDNPVIVDSTKKIPVGPYSINSQKATTDFSVQPIAPAQMVGEPLTKLYNALVKVGMGTYTTPYGELWYNSLRSKDFSAGLHLKHLSSSYTSQNYGYAGFSNDEAGIYGKKLLKKHIWTGNADYVSNIVHYYGYNPDLYSLSSDATKQQFNFYTANTQLKSVFTDPNQLNYDAKVGWYTLTDRFNTSETNGKVTGGIQKTELDIKKYKGKLTIDGLFDYYNYQATTNTVENTILSASPNYVISDSNKKATFGFTATEDLFKNSSKYSVYPNILYSHSIVDNTIIFYGGITGGLQKNSFKSFTDINPFVMSNLAMKNSSKYEFFGGFKGTFTSPISYNVRVSQQNISNMALFVNDTTGYKNKFDVIYSNATILNFHGELGYQMREKLRINLAGDYFNYSNLSQLKAWYNPQLKITASAIWNLDDKANKILNKISIRADVFYRGDQFAKTYDASGTAVAQQLKGIVDVNLGVDYRWTPRFSLFAKVNNLLNYRYYVWSNYPTQQINFMGGLSYSFQ